MESIRTLLLNGDVVGALNGAEQLAQQTKFRHSSDFMTLASRICILTRKWYVAQHLSSLALELNNFGTSESRHWCVAIAAYTAGCDLILRLVPENPTHWDQVHAVIAWFKEATALDVPERGIGAELFRDWLMSVSGRCHAPAADVQAAIRDALMSVSGKCGTPVLNDLRCMQRIHELSSNEGEWVLQVDASEVGNEARYINHADLPNAVLMNKPSHGSHHPIPVVIAIRRIEVGDEISVNYGAEYWLRIRHDRCSEPLLLGKAIEQPFTDCVYHDGLVYDYGCHSAPGGFLIPPGARATHQGSKLEIRRVAFDHPAYPGFGLYTKTEFQKGDVICIYGGIVDMSPFSGRTASKYTVDLTVRNPIGPFGLIWDPDTLTCAPVQDHLPFLNDYEDASVISRNGERIFDGLMDIRGVDPRTAQLITGALLIPGYRGIVRDRLKGLKPLPINATKNDIQVFSVKVRKLFGDILTKPPKRARVD